MRKAIPDDHMASRISPAEASTAGGVIEHSHNVACQAIAGSDLGIDDQRIEIDIDSKRSAAWLPHSILVQAKPVKTKFALQDNLLVSAMGGNAGLLAINRGESPKVRVIDRLNSAGMWVGYRGFVRAIYCKQMVLHIHASDSVSILTSPDYRNVHDVRVQFGQLVLVSTGTNEVVQLDFSGKLLRRWKFPGEGDTRHLNGIDLWNGRYVVSCFGRFEEERKYKDHGAGSGIVFDLETDETLWDGLYYPHSPRMRQGRQYICDSGTQRLLMRECDGGKLHEIRFPGAFARGIAFGEKHMYVGLSAIRAIKTGDASVPSARIAIIDQQSFQLLDEIDLPCSEIYEIVVPLNDANDSLLAFQDAM